MIFLKELNMCGIFVVSDQNAYPKLIKGLKNIEYRGYDSWGIAVLERATKDFSKTTHSLKQLEVFKKVGKIGEISDHEMNQHPESTLGIGHTRWATHGGVTQSNAHPHLSSD